MDLTVIIADTDLPGLAQAFGGPPDGVSDAEYVTNSLLAYIQNTWTAYKVSVASKTERDKVEADPKVATTK